MLISGGRGSSTKVEVEVISPGGNVSCSVLDLPQPRSYHNMNNNTVCGGYGGTGTDTETSCYQLTSAGWTRSHTLIHRRAGHSSWEVEDGIILLGGYHLHSSTTSEIAKWDGTTEEIFSMGYDTRYINNYSHIGYNPATNVNLATPVPSLTLPALLWC